MRTPWPGRRETRPVASTSAPVFVDDSGRRQRRFRRAGATGVLLSVGYLALAAIGLTGHGPLAGVRLPFVGGGAQKAHTVAELDTPRKAHGFAGGNGAADRRGLTLVAERHAAGTSNSTATSHAASAAAQHVSSQSQARTTQTSGIGRHAPNAPVPTDPPVDTTTTTFTQGPTNATTHGHSSTAPGQTTNGQAGNPPAHFGDTTTTLPGNSATAPGRVSTKGSPSNGTRA